MKLEEKKKRNPKGIRGKRTIKLSRWNGRKEKKKTHKTTAG